MNATKRYTAFPSAESLKLFGLLVFVLTLSSLSSSAQNTKGDKPSAARESRFKAPFQKGGSKRKAKTSKSNKRVLSRQRSTAGRANASTPGRASGKDRPGKPVRPIVKSKPSAKERAWKGDVAGYRIRSTLKSKSPAGTSRNVYPQHWMFVHNPSPKPRKTERAVSNRETLSKLQGRQSQERPPTGPKRRVVPRSASRSFTARKSINVYASFPRPKHKGEHASTKDLAGRRLRSKNFESPRPKVMGPTFRPYYGRSPMGDKPYDAKTSAGYRSASRAGQPWKGDIAGRRIRGRNYSSHKEGKIILPTAAKDRYGLGSARIGIFQGNIKGKRKAEKGGGSVSGQAWNNMGYPIGGGVPKQGQRIAGFQGNLKSRRQEKGGGSVSGQVWNNNEHPIGGGAPSQGSRVARFQGTIKGKRPDKGGGSVSGRVWNNNGQPIGGGSPSQGAGVAIFQGNIKTRRPEKGGGSVSGKSWNNEGHPIIVRAPKEGARAALFQGNIKTRRPEKGGGSVSGKLWNNKETPIPGTTPPLNSRRIGGYPGKYKLFELQPGFSDQGELFTGYVKLKKFRKNYVQNPHSVDDAIKQQRPNKTTKEAGGLQVRVKQPDYIQNKNSSEDALLKKRPSRNTFQAGELQVRVKAKPYGKKPNAAEGALPGTKPTKSSIKASEYARSLRRTWDYIHNPSSAEEALKTREPGKAFARSAAYQGNIKMQKYVLFEKNRALHPDTKFIRNNKNNVDEERDMLTNFKLWWARLFKKQETQPENLKYKGKKPRYDKGEAGLWNE